MVVNRFGSLWPWRVIKKYFNIIILLAFSSSPALSPPESIDVVFNEKSFDITWDSVAGATAYQIYFSEKIPVNKKDMRLVNKIPIQSGTHFFYAWQIENGKAVRKIKGYRNYIAITALFINGSDTVESQLSSIWTNDYFNGFGNAVTAEKIESVLRKKQNLPFIPVPVIINAKADFVRFMNGPGKDLSKEVRNAIDPLETGACAPVSIIATKLLSDYGMTAYRIEGQFIKEYHAFTIVNIDSVEYVLDFTADQFVPGVSPVLIPRDYCFLNDAGFPDTAGTPMYKVSRIYTSDKIKLSERKSADLYRTMYEKIKKNR